jgi:PAS domain-containing protein
MRIGIGFRRILSAIACSCGRWTFGVVAAYLIFHYSESQSRSGSKWSRFTLHAFCAGALGLAMYYLASLGLSFDLMELLQGSSVNGPLGDLTTKCIGALGIIVAGTMFQETGPNPNKKMSMGTGGSSNVQSAQTASLVLDLSGTAIAIVETDQRIRVWSQAFERLTNPNREVQLRGLPLERALGLSAGTQEQKLKSCFQAAGDETSNAVEFQVNDVQIQVNVSGMAGHGAAAGSGFVVVLKNLTEEREAAEKAQRTKELLETIETLSRNNDNGANESA